MSEPARTDPDESSPDFVPPLRFKRLDAVKGMVVGAVLLRARGAPEPAVYSLACAAYDVLEDLMKHDKSARTAIHEINEVFNQEGRRLWRRMRAGPRNQLQHADHDPEADVELRPDMTDFVLLTAAEAYRQLSGDTEISLMLYVLWYQLNHPDIFSHGPGFAQIQADASEAGLLGLSLEELLNVFGCEANARLLSEAIRQRRRS